MPNQISRLLGHPAKNYCGENPLEGGKTYDSVRRAIEGKTETVPKLIYFVMLYIMYFVGHYFFVFGGS